MLRCRPHSGLPPDLRSFQSLRNASGALAELDLLMQNFVDRQARITQSAPMHKIIAFAIFSTRRQEEITTLKWSDLDEQATTFGLGSHRRRWPS